MGSPNWSVFIAAAFLVGWSPGASNFVAFTNGVRSGFLYGVVALLGRFAAFSILLIIVAFGLGALIASSALAFGVIRWVGIAYLILLSWRLWVSDALPGHESVPSGTSTRSDLIRREFFVAILNPKALLIFTAFLPQFVVGTVLVVKQLFELATAYVLVELTAASSYAFIGSRIGSAKIGPAVGRLINRLTAVMMFGAAVWLAAANY